MEPTPSDIVQATVDTLLTVVARSADDLRAFHDALSKAHRASLPPFPRATVIIAQRVTDHLTMVDKELRELIVALGLEHTEGPR